MVLENLNSHNVGVHFPQTFIQVGYVEALVDRQVPRTPSPLALQQTPNKLEHGSRIMYAGCPRLGLEDGHVPTFLASYRYHCRIHLDSDPIVKGDVEKLNLSNSGVRFQKNWKVEYVEAFLDSRYPGHHPP